MTPLPTKLYLHLSSTSEYASFTIFTSDLRNEEGINKMPEYPFVCEFEASYAPGITTESVNERLPAIRLGALYQAAGKKQAELDSIKEQISKLLCIGHEKPREVEGEFVAFDDDIPF